MPNYDPVMPFGKHKGKPASSIPVGYLDWIISLDDISPQLKHEVTEHLKTRAEWHRLDDEGGDKDDGDFVDWKDPDFLK